MKSFSKIVNCASAAALLCGTVLMVPVFAQNIQNIQKTTIAELPRLTAQELRRREIAAMIEEYRNALFDDPQNGERHRLLAQQYILQGVADIAEHELLRAQELGISKETLLADFGRAYLLRHKYNQVIEEIVVEDAPETDLGEIYVVLAHAYYGIKDYQNAFNFYKNAEDIIGNHFELDAPLANIYNMAGEYELAAHHAKSALSFEGKNVEMLLLLGDLIHRKKGASYSHHYYGLAAFYQPDNLDAQVKSAGTLYNLNRYNEAMVVLRNILANDQTHPMANFLAASISAEGNNQRTARRYLDMAKTGLDDFPPALLLKGKLNYAIGSYGQVKNALNRLIAIEPDNLEARRFLAASLLHLKENRRAVSVLEYMVNENKLYGTDYLLLGNAYIQVGNYEKGSNYFAAAANQKLDQINFLKQLTLENFEGGRAAGVQLNIDGIINISSFASQQMILTGFEAINSENYDLAIDLATKIIDQDRTSPIGFNLLGLAYLGQEKLDEARSNFRKSIDLDRNFHHARLNIAKLELIQGRENDAITSLNKILSVDESYLAAYELLYDISQKNNDLIRAERYLITAISADPKSLDARVRLAEFYFENENLSKAKNIATKMIADFPERGEPYRIMGRVNLYSGDNADAIGNFLQCLSYDNEDQNSHIYLSDAYVKNGEADKARPALEKGLKTVKNKLPLMIELIRLAEHDGNYKSSYLYASQLKLDENLKAQAFIYQGILNLAEGKSEEAIKSFESANKAGGNKNLIVSELAKINVAEDNDDMRYNYAIALNNSGASELAAQELEKIVNSGRISENISKARELLSSLR